MLKSKINFYDILEKLTVAGVPLTTIFAKPMPGKLRKPCIRIAERLAAGLSLAEAMNEQPCFSRLECTLIHVGCATGRLEACAAGLRDHFQQRLTFRQQLISALLYPLFVFIVAVPLLKIVDLAVASFQNGCGTDFCSWGQPLVVHCLLWYGIPVATCFAVRMCWKAICQTALLGAVADVLPLWGTLQYRQQTASFFSTLSLCLSSGVSMAQSVRFASSACSSGFYARRYEKLAQAIEKGISFTEAYTSISCHRDNSEQVLTLIATGELTGSLDATSSRIATYLYSAANTTLTRFTKVFPVVAYVALAMYLAFKIISFYLGYINAIMSL